MGPSSTGARKLHIAAVVSGNGILATTKLPWMWADAMERWGCWLLLLATLSVNQAQLKRQRFRELDPVRRGMPRFPGSPGAGEHWFATSDGDCPFSLPLWALLVGLSGTVALFVLRFRGRGVRKPRLSSRWASCWGSGAVSWSLLQTICAGSHHSTPWQKSLWVNLLCLEKPLFICL